MFPRELDDLEGCIKKDLTQLEKEDAVEFFRKQGVKGTRVEFEEIFRIYGSHPLSIRLLSGMIMHDLKYNGDVKVWTKHNPLLELIQKEHHVLELAYNSLDKKKRSFISKLSAFRNPMDYEVVSIFNDFGDEEKFNGILNELVDRGMLFRDEKSNKFDMHPVVRKYCYDRLREKEGVHSRLRDYFAAIPAPKNIESVDDLAPVIELYHHTVRAGRYDEAAELYRDRLVKQLYFRFGAYQTIIELLRDIFPDSEAKSPRLKNLSAQVWALNELANSYSRSGQPRLAVSMYEMAKEIVENQGDKENVARVMSNLAQMAQTQIGELDIAESNLRRSIKISFEIKKDFLEAIGHRELGRLLVYRGKFEESEKEFTKAMDYFKKLNYDYIGALWASRALCSIHMNNADEAFDNAKKAKELGEKGGFAGKLEGQVIQAEYLLGAAYLMKGNLSEAESHLNEALIRDRKIVFV